LNESPDGFTVLGVNYDYLEGAELQESIDILGIEFPTLIDDPQKLLGYDEGDGSAHDGSDLARRQTASSFGGAANRRIPAKCEGREGNSGSQPLALNVLGWLGA
jgi:hypothetical protein